MDSSSFSSLGILAIPVFIIAVAWGILMLFAPFFWYGAWYRAKQIDKKMEENNRLLRVVAYGPENEK